MALDETTFPGAVVPAGWVAGPAGIDMQAALLMLGTVTIPGGLSPASPAKYWAWIRYLAAIDAAADLRIATPFSELDPHLKSVLSDDFGVAVSMQWFCAQLSGIRTVVDGRRFVLHYAHLMNQLTPTSAKIGPRKCPDFVIQDTAGKWHVVECKGTQTSTRNSDGQLVRAREQKSVISLGAAVAGHSLAMGVFLCAENTSGRSRLMIQDPAKTFPLIRLEEVHEAKLVSARLSIANALGLAGFAEFSEELAYVEPREESLLQYQSLAERKRGRRSPEERNSEAVRSLGNRHEVFESHRREFVGRRMQMDINVPSFGNEELRAVVSVGMSGEFIAGLRSLGDTNIVRAVEESLGSIEASLSMTFESDQSKSAIRLGNVFTAELTFT